MTSARLIRPRLALATLLLAGTLPAHGDEVPAMPASVPPGSTAPAQPKPPSISFDFRGGSLAQLVTLVGKTEGRSFNLLTEHSLPSVSLPAFTIRNADPVAFTKALNLLVEKFNLRVELMVSETFGTEPVAVITLKRKEPAPRPSSTDALDEFDSFQLKSYLPAQSVNDIVGAIRAAWELDPAHDAKAVRLKYNQATKLLLISGPPEAVMIAHRVVAHLATEDKSAPAHPPDTTGNK